MTDSGRPCIATTTPAGHDLRILSRHPRESGNGTEYAIGDLRKNQGIQAAVEGTGTILHLAGGRKGDDEATRNLVRAAGRAGVEHLVYISVVGADTVPLGYFRAKLGAESAVTESGIPFTTLRSAQFHDLVLTVVEKMAKLPVVPKPGGLRFQPVDSRDVATRLVELALGAPAGRVPDLVGPKVYGLTELVRGHLQAHGKHRLSIPLRIPGEAGRAYRAGRNLTLTGTLVGTRTWEEFVAERSATVPVEVPTRAG